MAGGVNKVILVGNLGNDPELKYTGGGTAVCNMRIATSESWTDKNGEKKEETEWHRITVWGKLGELCSQYLSKGRQVYLEGKIKTREWQDKEGQKRWTTEIHASHVVFLSGGKGEGGSRTSDSGQRGGSGRSSSTARQGGEPYGDDDFNKVGSPPPPRDDDGDIPF